MVIVTKVPLCGYYFPDDDEIVWRVCHMFYLPGLVCSPLTDNGESNCGVILAATSGKKYLLAHTFVLKQTVLKQSRANTKYY
ncbi:hypothetical protein N6P31_11010 [Pectobacterium betavasculorum]|uniref:hypothetical protein n=1 Tax=Pectobacterium betavasculorum TaxID=55207 RepID=UPI000B2AECBE|nr:hypothetical protein [Pectobacterium betavasculorum]